jgi:hypothetical protein
MSNLAEYSKKPEKRRHTNFPGGVDYPNVSDDFFMKTQSSPILKRQTTHHKVMELPSPPVSKTGPKVWTDTLSTEQREILTRPVVIDLTNSKPSKKSKKSRKSKKSKKSRKSKK